MLLVIAAATVPALRSAHRHTLTDAGVRENAVHVATITTSVAEARRNVVVMATRGDAGRSTSCAACRSGGAPA